MLDYAGDFEVHVTVRSSNADALERFHDWCAQHECKCIHIVLARGMHVNQPMATWRRTRTTLPMVLADVQSRTATLEAELRPVRVKIETAPDNDGVPRHDAEANGQGTKHFEHHVKLLRAATADQALLLQTCSAFDAHLSRNARRQNSDGKEERFVTMRNYGVGRATAELRLQQLLAALTVMGETVMEVESEYVVYDSNLLLDAGWLHSTTETAKVKDVQAKRE